MNRLNRLLLALATCFSMVYGQTSGTGALAGAVTDPTGAVIPNVAVTATNMDTGQERSTVTNANGGYSLTLLPPGNYRVKFAANGFKTSEVSSLKINVTETPVLDHRLEIGAQAEQVTVEANIETVQTSNATMGTVLGAKTIIDLPLNTRNYTNILALSAGANAAVNNATGLGNGAMNIAVNGSTTAQNNFQMDGVSVVNFGSGGATGSATTYAGLIIPNPDALAEFKIQTSLYDAGFGRNPGANVNVVTKSGTNQFHGSAFEFFRNRELNANDFFLNRSGQQRPILNQNQYGGGIGGPIKKDKLFFFFSFQETNQKNGAATQAFATATLAPIPQGDRSNTAAFRSALGQQFCPGNHPGDARYNVFSGIQVACDGSNINPVAINVLQAKYADGRYIIPGSTNGDFQVTPFSIPAIYNEDQYIGNGDYLLNSKNTISTRYFYSHNPQTTPFVGGCGTICLPGAAGKLEYAQTSAQLKLTTVLTNSIVNEARTNFLRNVSNLTPTVTVTDPQLGITPVNALIPGLTPMNVNGLFRAGGSDFDNAAVYVNQISFGDQLSWTHGKHTIRFGGEFERFQFNWNYPGLARGVMNFQTMGDFLIGLPGCTPGDATCSVANPGNTNGSSFSNINSTTFADKVRGDGLVHAWRGIGSAAFFQDDIKVSQRLTLNLGLRWELDGTVNEKYGYMTGLWASEILRVPIPGSTPATGSYAGYVVPSNYNNDPVLPSDALRNSINIPMQNAAQKNNFAPRIGFAWQPMDSNRLVVRGGYGWFYNRIPGDNFIHSAVEHIPYSNPYAQSGNANYFASFAAPFNPTPGPNWIPRWVNLATGASSNIFQTTVQQRFLTPVTYSWNLNVQYQFAPRWVLELAYVGSHGIHQNNTYNINIPKLASPSNPIWGITTSTTTNASVRVPLLGFSPQLNQESTDGDLKFNSFQATVRKQLSYGLTLQAAYTWSRGLTNVPRNTNDPMDSAQLYGTSTIYRPHRLVLNYSWQIPTGKMSGIAQQVLGGWTLSGVTTIQNGTPMTILDGRGGTIYGAPAGTTSRAQMAPGATYASIASSGGITDRLGGNSKGCGYFSCTLSANGLPTGAAAFTAFTAIPNAVLPNGTVTNGTGWGNSGVGVIIGPGQVNFDMSLSKAVRVGGIRENAQLQFRAEFFNIMNHAQFNNPALNLQSAATFGQITSTSVNPRLLQFALKYVF
jgi:hypothetical protein